MRPRIVLLCAVAILVVLGVGTAALLLAQHRADTAVSCDVTARRADDPSDAPPLPASILEKYPALTQAVSSAASDGFGIAALPCGQRESLLGDLEASDITQIRDTAYVGTVDGVAYEIEVARNVA